jgi:hypothetical protein
VSTSQRQVSSAFLRLRAYLQLVRLPNLFTAMADVLMGFLFTHAALGSSDGWILGLLLGASTCLYAAGVVLNDVFDFEADCRQRPERPLPSGRISLSAARWLGWELLVFGLALAWTVGFLMGDFRPGVVAALLAGSIVLYDAILKRTPVGPLAMGACRMLNVLLGMSTAAGAWRDEHWLVAACIGTYIVGVTWFARREALSHGLPTPDPSRPDGEACAGRWALAGATAVMLLGLGLLSLVPSRSENLWPPLETQGNLWYLLLCLLAGMIGLRCVLAIIEPVPHRVQTAVRVCILSLVMLDAAACLVVRGPAGAVAVLLLLVPAAILGRWIEST